MGRYFNLMWMVMTHFSDIKSKCLKEKVNMTIFEIFSVTKDTKKESWNVEKTKLNLKRNTNYFSINIKIFNIKYLKLILRY